MKRYDSYKDSGVEWVGEIPSHWGFGKLYQYSEMCNGSTPSRDKPEYWEDGTIPWMSSGEINKKRIREIEGRITKKGFENSSTKLLPVGTVMMGLNGQGKTKGTVGILEIETTCNQSLCGMIFKDFISPMFSYYYLDSQYYHIRGLVGEGQREGISVSFLGRYQIVVPPMIEQNQIVSFLDTKTSQIDELIQKKKRKIELLKEYRTSLINLVVTKGLNPNVEMKDSGVEWIGEIPSPWGTTKIKYTTDGSKYSFIDGDWIESNNLSEDGIRYITTGNIGEGFYKEQGKGYISEETFNNLNCTEVLEGDLVISRLSLPVGRSCIIPFIHHKVVTSVDNVILRPKSEFSKHYLNYQFNSKKYFDYTELISRGTTLTRISRGMLGNNPIVSPPLSEQQQIVSYLDEQTQKIDSSIQFEEKKIQLLIEYRQSLISEVVTGKIKVI